MRRADDLAPRAGGGWQHDNHTGGAADRACARLCAARPHTRPWTRRLGGLVREAEERPRCRRSTSRRRRSLMGQCGLATSAQPEGHCIATERCTARYRAVPLLPRHFANRTVMQLLPWPSWLKPYNRDRDSPHGPFLYGHRWGQIIWAGHFISAHR